MIKRIHCTACLTLEMYSNLNKTLLKKQHLFMHNKALIKIAPTINRSRKQTPITIMVT